MKCYHPTSAVIAEQNRCPPSQLLFCFFFNTQEVSVSKKTTGTEVQSQLKGHLVLDEVGMCVPAFLTSSLSYSAGWGWTLKAPVEGVVVGGGLLLSSSSA